MNDINNRNAGIGASDAPIIAGLSPWRTPVELWQEKIGAGKAQAEDWPMRAGKALEQVVLDAFAEEHGSPVTSRGERVIDPAWPARWVTLDGLTEGGSALVEAKTDSDASEWGEPGTDQIPPQYVVQVQHALACTQLFVAYVPVLIGLRELRIYQVQRDDRIVAQLTDMERRFWGHVQSGEAPAMLRPSDLRLIYPKDAGTSIAATPGIRATLDALKAQMAHAKAIAKDIDAWKAELQSFMGTAATLTDVDGKPLATWRTTKPVTRFDEKALQKDQPDLWRAYKRPGATQRQFLVKGAKNDAVEET